MLIFLLITQIGFQPNNLILLDLAKYQSNCLFLADASETTSPATENLTIKKPNKSWMISELLGEYTGSVLLSLGSTFIEHYFRTGNSYMNLDSTNMSILGGIGFSTGTGFGIWTVGKYIEKEKASLTAPILGNAVGLLVCLGINQISFNNKKLISEEALPFELLIPYSLGLICYRKTGECAVFNRRGTTTT